jgi:aspartokinase/homoserine dehydrogenase 1
VKLVPVCPVEGSGGVEAWIKRTARLDGDLAGRWKAADRRGRRRRFVARVDRGCSAGPAEVPVDSALGRLAGPENVFAFRTERYADHPLVVSGPGAGPEVTAAGAFADIIRIARAVGRTS